ncbi:MAG: 5'-nucleotidase C-terminal domain-containing protein [Paracoccus sp. (in: a-proteobacteria)]|uniref:5'-nucleotidase C-terminal domain-containing protein n=1 Tax=Paracoccus sp. TaxID=267 RepID=UPI0026E10159|nr:5'-nucleotidase C-terminal domain-containing protein [Paracoccus sp. (in: a-proteobacteria)]MDO5622000.1 5'-nucleotidase C-terminal domain-containing protein [Paracoccus sp. (in: a-proteobacteria)]
MPDGISHDSRCTTDQGASPDSIHLRLLATTDLHMHILPWDYFNNRPDSRLGLARLAGLIQTARQEAPNCLLLDNGDFLQGNPLADLLARDDRGPHPMIAAMAALGYDAATLGNHDFSFGPRFLRRVLAQATWPFVVSNAQMPGVPWLPHLILDRRFRDDAGQLQHLRIGLLGVLPPQTPQWEAGLSRHLQTQPILPTARDAIARLQDQGADLIVALAHSGIGGDASLPESENLAEHLAALDGIDAVIAGHTHLAFPDPSLPPQAGVDPAQGRLAGKPAVMPGFWGSHLGVIDLHLHYDGGWHVAAAKAELRQPDTTTPGSGCTLLPCTPAKRAHQQAQRHLNRRIAWVAAPLNSHFTALGHDRGLRLTAQALRWHLRKLRQRLPLPDLPVLVALAPVRAGGRGGPSHYTDIPAGPLTLRHVFDLYPFPNTLAARIASSAQIKDWLELGATGFTHMPDAVTERPLLDPDFPPYAMDLIDGLHWQLDVSQPAGKRIRNLTCKGQPVAAQDQFILLTNSYRVSGNGGGYGKLAAEMQALDLPQQRIRDLLHRYLRQVRRVVPHDAPFFTLKPPPGSRVTLDTAPTALPPPSLQPQPRPTGQTTDGFARFQLRF